MASRNRPFVRLACITLALAAAPTFALQRGFTRAGDPFVSGGVGIEERAALLGERAGYDLWVATLARPSGAYLSDARLRITREQGGVVVFEGMLDGPWLFVALPAGRYRVVVEAGVGADDTPSLLAVTVDVKPGVLRQAVLRFDDAEADVGPERLHQSSDNPFGAEDSRPAGKPGRRSWRAR